MGDWINVPEDISQYLGFVYIITCIPNGKKYVGKKKFWFKNNKYIARKPTKAENDKLTRLSKRDPLKYDAFKKQLKIKYRGKKKRIRGFKESDWKEYFGSGGKKMQSDIALYGKKNFKREILECYETAFECSYNEMVYQVEHEVLFRTDYYNEIIDVKLRKVAKSEPL